MECDGFCNEKPLREETQLTGELSWCFFFFVYNFANVALPVKQVLSSMRACNVVPRISPQTLVWSRHVGLKFWNAENKTTDVRGRQKRLLTRPRVYFNLQLFVVEVGLLQCCSQNSSETSFSEYKSKYNIQQQKCVVLEFGFSYTSKNGYCYKMAGVLLDYLMQTISTDRRR